MADYSYLFNGATTGVSSNKDLSKAQKSNATLSAQAASLGLKDTSGKGVRGFLQGALDYITRPQSAVLGAITGATGYGVKPGEQTTVLGRALAAIQGKERYSGTDVLNQALGAVSPTDSVLSRLGRATAGIGIDIATDPLNYLTGKGVLRGEKRAAAVEAQTTVSAKRALEPFIAKEKPTTTSVLGTSTDTALNRAKNTIQNLTESPKVSVGEGVTAPSLSRPPVTPVEAIARTTPLETPRTYTQAKEENVTNIAGTLPESLTPTVPTAPIPNDLIAQVAQASAGGGISGGARGSYEAVRNVLSNDARIPADQVDFLAKDIINKAGAETAGGIGLKLPFLSKTPEGELVSVKDAPVGSTRRVATLTPSGTNVIDDLGLRAMADSTRNVYNGFRTGKAYTAWSKLMNGANGEAYADVIRHNYTGGKEGMSYESYRKLVNIDKTAMNSLYYADKAAVTLLQTAQEIIQKGDNPEDIKKYMDEFASQAGSMVLPLNATPDQQRAFNIVADLRTHGDSLTEEARAAYARATGQQIGDVSTAEAVSSYQPRAITKEHRDFLKLRNKNSLAFDPTIEREYGYYKDPITGEIKSRSNKELNIMYKEIDPSINHNVFEEDAMKIAAQQYSSLATFTNRMNLIGDLRDSGLLTERLIDKNPVKLVNLPKLNARMDRFDAKLAEKVANQIQKLHEIGTPDAIAQMDEVSAKLAVNKKVIDAILSSVNDMSPESLKSIGTLTTAMKDSLRILGDNGINLTKDEKKSLFSAHGIIKERVKVLNSDELKAEDLLPLGLDSTIRIPKGLTNMYADQSVKAAVEKMFKVEKFQGAEAIRPFMEKVYGPYYSLFKTYATVGNIGGYHMRNLFGAWWNNYLGDVSALDHKLSAGVQLKQMNSQLSAQNAMENLYKGEKTGLSGDADAIAKMYHEYNIANNIPLNNSQVSTLKDVILLNELDKIKVGSHTLADIYTSALDNGLFRGSRKLETMRNDARLSGTEMADNMLSPLTRNLFKGIPRDELTKHQTILNKLANWKAIEVSGNAADISENYVRLAAYIKGIRNYGLTDNGQAASYFVKALQFDYADLSDFERNVLKNIIPFYTWTRRNVPLQFTALLNEPAKFNKIAFAQTELQNSFGAEGDQAGMSDIVPQWMRDKMGFVTNIDVNGNPIVTGFELPAMDLNRYIPFGFRPTFGFDAVKQNVVSSLNPVMKTGIEALTGVNTFTGAPFPVGGTATPYNINIPGITNLDKNGKPVMNAQWLNATKNLIPPLGRLLRLSDVAGSNKDRIVSNYASSLLGLPLSTLTPSQATGELIARNKKLSNDIVKTVNNKQMDRNWLIDMVNSGYDASQIQEAFNSGYGRPVK